MVSTTPPDPDPTSASGGARSAALDGLRGVTIVLVMINHANDALWPRAAIEDVPVLRGFFTGGSVTLFFVVGGFIVSRNLLRDHARARLDGVLFVARRVVRLWVHLLPLALVVLLWQTWDVGFGYTWAATISSVLAALTFTSNLTSVFGARGDFGHLWYLGVQQQMYLALPLLVLLLGKRRIAMVVACSTGFVLVTVNRYEVLESRGWGEASIGTFTRSDGLVLGVLLAAALPWLSRRVGWARWLLAPSVVAGLVLLGARGELDDPFQYLKAWGVAYTLVCGLIVVAVVVTPRRGWTVRALSLRPLAVLGRSSLALFVWHMPVIALTAHYLGPEHWTVKTGVAIGSLSLVAWVSERYLDGPARRWLATHLRPSDASGTSRPTVAVRVGHGSHPDDARRDES